MNERIKELAEQAGITTNLDTDFFEKDPNKWVDYFSEKFAELIVRECAAYLNGAIEVHNQREQDLCDLTARKIKEHFGIQESPVNDVDRILQTVRTRGQ